MQPELVKSEEIDNDEKANIVRIQDPSIPKTIWDWMLVPVFEGFGQTVVFGVIKRAAIKVIQKIRGK